MSRKITLGNQEPAWKMLAAWAPVPPGRPASSHLSWAGRSLCWLSLLPDTCLGCAEWAPQGQSPSPPFSRPHPGALISLLSLKLHPPPPPLIAGFPHSDPICLPLPACALLSLLSALRVCPTTQRPSSHGPCLLKFLGMPWTPQGSQDAHFWPIQVLVLKSRTI